MAFAACNNLISVTIGNGVTNLAQAAFQGSPNLETVYFEGNAPGADTSVFSGDSMAIVYYLAGTKGWESTFAGLPTRVWMQPTSPYFAAAAGVRTNRFGFTITSSSNTVVVVEACTNLANPGWSPVATNTLTLGSSYFSDPQWKTYPRRFYRLRSP